MDVLPNSKPPLTLLLLKRNLMLVMPETTSRPIHPRQHVTKHGLEPTSNLATRLRNPTSRMLPQTISLGSDLTAPVQILVSLPTYTRISTSDTDEPELDPYPVYKVRYYLSLWCVLESIGYRNWLSGELKRFCLQIYLWWWIPKGGTLVHEASHFKINGGTDDLVYGQAGCKNLAIRNPDQAVKNADSHEYFAENNPPLA